MTTQIAKSTSTPIHTRAILLGIGLMAALGSMAPTQGADAYWWGTTSGLWSEDNWSSTDASSSAIFNSYTPVNGDTLRWYWSATSNTTSTNDLTGLSVAQLDFRRTSASITLEGNPLTITSAQSIQYGAGHTINLDLVLEATYAAISLGGASTMTINGNISEAGGTRNVLVSGGPLDLNGSNSFTGTLTISGGNTITINTLANVDTPQSLGQGSIQFGSGGTEGAVRYTGGTTSTDKPFQIGRQHASINVGGGAFINDGSGAVVWTGTQVLTPSTITSPRTFTLGGTNSDDNDWQGGIADNNATSPISLAKDGAGLWILSGVNTFSGNTTVNEGTLLINGDQSAATGAVTVSADAAIGGGGTIGGSLTLASGAKFWFDPAYTLTVNGGTVNLGNLGIGDILNLDSSVADDTYTLLAGTFTLNHSSPHFGLANAYDLGDKKFAYFEAGSLSLVVLTIPEPTSLALLGLAGLAALRRRRGRKA